MYSKSNIVKLFSLAIEKKGGGVSGFIEFDTLYSWRAVICVDDKHIPCAEHVKSGEIHGLHHWCVPQVLRAQVPPEKGWSQGPHQQWDDSFYPGRLNCMHFSLRILVNKRNLCLMMPAVEIALRASLFLLGLSAIWPQCKYNQYGKALFS